MCNGSCTVDVGDYDHAQWSTQRTARARKKHECYECAATIVVGEEHEVVVGSWDGEFLAFRTCSTCVSVRRVFFSDGWLFGAVWDQLREHIVYSAGQIPGHCLEPLTENARGKVVALIDERLDIAAAGD